MPLFSLGSTSRKRSLQAAGLVLYASATLQFIRFYVTHTVFYLNLAAYLGGRERQPFQERILPAILMRWFYRSPHLVHLAQGHTQGAFTIDRAPFFLISLLSMVTASYFVQRLYQAVSTSGVLWFLVYPTFLFAMIWTYALRSEANFSYPYDLLAVAFFSAGLFFIYTDQYVPLMLVVLLGTFNRETTLFLIAIYVIDAVACAAARPRATQTVPWLLRAVPWVSAGSLLAIWLAIKLGLAHRFVQNNNTENYVRVRDNVRSLGLRLLPALLNICGYLLPIVLLRRNLIANRRFRSYLWVLPLWFGVMFYTGVLVETRIYGELCPYVAVALVLIMERHIATAQGEVPEAQRATRSGYRLAA